MRAFALLSVVALFSVVAPELDPPLQAQSDTATESIFRLHVIRSVGENWRTLFWDTAFFVDPAGTAVTKGSAVRIVRENPNTFKLLAVKGGTFYGATALCATSVSRRPGPLADDEFEKDVGTVRIGAADLPFDTWGYVGASGSLVIEARKHQGPIPSFRPLVIGSDPRVGDPVRRVAYGQSIQVQPATQIDPIPRPSVGEGRVTRVFVGQGNVSLFAAEFRREQILSISPAAVVNAEGQLVGLIAWSRSGPPAEEIAISASALREPCRQ